MKDILKSVAWGIILVTTIILSAPFLNDEDKNELSSSATNLEPQSKKDIHIPL